MVAGTLRGPAACAPVGSGGGAVPVLPREGWERALAWWRHLAAGWLARHPVWVSRVVAARAWGLWAGVVLLAVLLLVSDRYRSSLAVYAACWWTLLLWWVAARTKTISWFAVAKMFSGAVVWAGFIAWVSFRLTASSGLRVWADGPGTAIAALGEEALKLAPLALIALVGPGRVRRFAAVDWLLLGLAAGMGFQAWEDLVRRLVTKVDPSIVDVAGGQGPGSGFPQYDGGLLAGGFGLWQSGGVYGYAGHHMTTALVGAAVGLAVALWRARSLTDVKRRQTDATLSPWLRRNAFRPPGARLAAVALPLLAWFCVTADHFGYNAASRDRAWTGRPAGTGTTLVDSDAVATSAPWVFRVWWEHTGQGTGRGWLLLALLIGVLLVDAHRLLRAGPWTDLGPAARLRSTGGASWLASPRELADRFADRIVDRFGRRHGGTVCALRALAALVVFTARDLAVITVNHARGSGNAAVPRSCGAETRLAGCGR